MKEKGIFVKTQTSQINDLRGFSKSRKFILCMWNISPKSIQTRKLETLALNWTSEMPAKVRLGKPNGDGMGRLQRRLAVARNVHLPRCQSNQSLVKYTYKKEAWASRHMLSGKPFLFYSFPILWLGDNVNELSKCWKQEKYNAFYSSLGPWNFVILGKRFKTLWAFLLLTSQDCCQD